MAANLQIEYSPEGIASVREKRFAFQTAGYEYEQARRWARDLARSVVHKRELNAELRVTHEARIHAAAVIERRFRQLADQWNNETGHYSITFKRAMHPAYQQIIGMGEKAIPHILKQLQDDPNRDWFWALKAITGQDPAREEANVDRAIQAWIAWGIEHHYV
jgi:hypothetical protein